jgi:hypothetical protein
MHIVDSDDIPLESVVHQLLSDTGLRRLLGDHAVACFVLARSGLVPSFYERLIENVHTIDETTRHHIAFIVFHGKRSSLVRQDKGTRRLYRHHLDGLSVSKNTDLRWNLGQAKVSKPHLAQQFVEAHRAHHRTTPIESISLATDMATSLLMRRYDLREKDLPCLLFVDWKELRGAQVVRLASADPITSMYQKVLSPLADQFHLLRAFWHERDRVARLPTDRAAALATLAAFPDSLVALEGSLDSLRQKLKWAENQRNSVDWRELESRCAVLSRSIKELKETDNLTKQTALLPPEAPEYAEIQSLQKSLNDLEDEKKRTSSENWSDEQRHRLASINGLRSRLAVLVRSARVAIKEELSDVREGLRKSEEPIKCLIDQERWAVSSIKNLKEQRVRAQQLIDATSQTDIDARHAALAKWCADLRQIGYGDNVLLAPEPRALDVVRTLATHGLVGESTPTLRLPMKPLKILFLAANPQQTTRLDLEEELRAIQVEIRGSRYRDNISLSAQHAVRPDDLVRYCRIEKPDVIHFSGHGSPDGIVLRDDGSNGSRSVRGEALAGLFKDRGIRLVVLNSCFSTEQARMISTAVETVVGTSAELNDEAARRFSVAFYRTLAEGFTVGDALRDAKDALRIYELHDVYGVEGNMEQKIIADSSTATHPQSSPMGNE